jgi:uncharacterized protein (DUF1810 family)
MENLDQFNLVRFERAQQRVYEQVCDELREGKKCGHWMWFIFPQIQGLGSSPTAQKYAISSLNEAQAYLSHSVLGSRLLECSRLFLSIEGKTPNQILGFPDDLKLKSSMTLFERSMPLSVFSEVLESRYGGERCLRTQRTLEGLPH